MLIAVRRRSGPASRRGRSRPASYRALDVRIFGSISSKVHDAVRGVPVDGKALHILDYRAGSPSVGVSRNLR